MLHLHIKDTLTKKRGDIKVNKKSNIVSDSVFISDILKIEPERDYIIVVLNVRSENNDVEAVLEFIKTYDILKYKDSDNYCYSLSDLMRLWWSASLLQINFEVEKTLAKMIYDEIFTDKYTKNQVLSILYDGRHSRDPHLDLYLTKFHGYNKIVEIFRLPVDNKVFYRNLISDKTVSYDRSTGEIILYNTMGQVKETIYIDDIPINISFHTGNRDIALTYDDHIILYGNYLCKPPSIYGKYKIWIIDVTQCIEDFGSMRYNNNKYIKWLNKFDSEHYNPRGYYLDNRSSVRDLYKDNVKLSIDGTTYGNGPPASYYVTGRYVDNPYYKSVYIKYQDVENNGHIITMVKPNTKETIPIVYFYSKYNPLLQKYKHLPRFSKYNFNTITMSPDERLIMFSADNKINVMNLDTRKIILQLNAKLIDFDNIMLLNCGLIMGTGIVNRRVGKSIFNFDDKYYTINLDGKEKLIGYGPHWMYKADPKYSLLYNKGYVIKFGSKKVWFKKLLEKI